MLITVKSGVQAIDVQVVTLVELVIAVREGHEKRLLRKSAVSD